MKQLWTDEYYMRMALDLARRGLGKTTPNPMVGCVIVTDCKVVGRGWHDHLGGLHAEAAALLDAGEKARGATAYVTLEPCSHQGRQPPCAPALVSAGITRCVCAIGDPNPKVAGRGLQILREAGIETVCGVLADEAAWLNRGFLSLQVRGRPWVTLKAAISVDGSMSLANGESRWVTGAAARTAGHLLRSENDAIVTGSGTITVDNPALTVRDVEGTSPRPVVLCADLRCLEGRFKALNERMIVFGVRGTSVPEQWCKQVHLVPRDAHEGLDLKKVLDKLGQLGLARVLLEAGPRLTSSFIASGLVDEYHLFAASKFMGEGRKITTSLHLEHMGESLPIVLCRTRTVGADWWLEGGNPCSQDWLNRLARS